MVACNFHVLGNLRKYSYHTTENFLEFLEQGSGRRGVVLQLEIQGDGGILRMGIPKALGGEGVDLEFLRETDKSVLLKTFIFWT